MVKLIKWGSLFAPFFLFLVSTQVHLIQLEVFAIAYVIFSLWFAFRNFENTNNIWKLIQSQLLKGSVLTLCFIYFIRPFYIGGHMTAPLVVPHSTEKAEAVLVLASDCTLAGELGLSNYQRILHGWELVKKGQAEHLYISTGWSSKHRSFAEADAVASFTKLIDLPKDKYTIFRSEEIETTATEVAYAKKFFEAKGIKRILLTTSLGHIYRSCKVVEKTGLEVLPAPCHTPVTAVYGAEGFHLFRAALHEYLGLVWYYLHGYI